MYKRNSKDNSKVAIINSKTWTLKDVVNLLLRNDKAVERAILLLYSFQTDDEKRYGHTGEWNGVGFNRYDANILSTFAEQLLQKKKHLTYCQMFIARKKVIKYAKQIFNYMLSKNENT